MRENKQAFLAKNHGSNYLQIKLGNIAFNESIVVEYTYLVSLKVKRLLQSFFQCFSHFRFLQSFIDQAGGGHYGSRGDNATSESSRAGKLDEGSSSQIGKIFFINSRAEPPLSS